MKIWLTFMCGPGSLEDLRELCAPIRQYFDGIVCTYHGEKTDTEAVYLEEIKGEGRVIYLPYSGRHDFSRNAYLYCGPIQQGDWCVHTDVLERPAIDFCSNLRAFRSNLQSHGVNSVFFYNKPLLYQYHESLEFIGTPHETIRRGDSGLRSVELSQYMPNEAEVRLNVRPLKRKDEWGWISHYLRYYLSQPWGSNHCLLGNSDRTDKPMEEFERRERVRLQVRDYLRERRIPLTVSGFKSFLTSAPIDDKMRGWINEEKILLDAYRYYVLGARDMTDEHKWLNLRKI